MEMEQINKVVKLHDNSLKNEEQVVVDKSGGGDNEMSDNELSDMDKLPNEILMEILSYLYENELVKCRLVNTQWNEICCVLLQNKAKNNPKSKLVVRLQKSPRVNTFHCTTVKRGFFSLVLKCFSPSEAGKSSNYHHSRPIPLSCFSVKDLYYLTESQIIRFVSTFGPHMKSFGFDVKKQDCKNFEILWKLLLKFAPNIEHLGIGGDVHIVVEDQTDSFLHNLKSIEIINDDGFRGVDYFIKQLLNNAPNIKEVFTNFGNFAHNPSGLDVLEVFQRLEKRRLIKQLKIGSLAQNNLSPVELMKNIRLESLTADCELSSVSVENEKSAINYINHALKSSQGTLSKLELWNLSLESMKFCFKDIKSLPNVRQLKIQIPREHQQKNGSILDRLSQLFPNTTSLNLGSTGDDFSSVARILLARFARLKSLKFSLNMTNKKNTLLLVDSEICGYSQDSIQKIQAKLKEGISLEEARHGEEQNPSILHLKDLSRLELLFFMGKRTNEKEEVENQLWNSFFVKILPQHTREYPRSIIFRYCK